MDMSLVPSFRLKKSSSKALRRCRGQKGPRGDYLAGREIPSDLMIEILTRLPAKSLMRFKCVSKLWFSLIISRYFTNLHLKVPSPPPTPRLYMTLVDHLLCNDSLEVCHNPYDSVLLSTSSSKARSFDQSLTMPGMGGSNMLIFHGLVLYNVCRKVCIYNPTTRQKVTLPAVPSHIFAQEAFRKNVLYYFGHDTVLDQYKILCTVVVSSEEYESITSEHWVYVLEAGGFWKKIESGLHHRPTRTGVCINGIIYYLAATSGLSRDIVVSFNVRSEEFGVIQAPTEVLPSVYEYIGFIEYAGRPTIFDYTQLLENGVVDLWVLEDAGKLWSKKPLALKPCQIHLLDHLLDEEVDLFLEGTTRKGEVIFAPLDLLSPFYILYYDPHKNDLRKVKIRGIPDHWFGKPDTNLRYYVALMDGDESIMHLEL